MLTVGRSGLQSVRPGVDVLLIQGVPPHNVLGIREAKLRVSPNIDPAQKDLCGGESSRQELRKPFFNDLMRFSLASPNLLGYEGEVS